MILVTGANGFLGSKLLLALSKENTPVRATYRTHLPDYLKEIKNVEWQQCDLLDVDAVTDCMQHITHVYHCANAVSFAAADAENLMHNNVESTANIINASLENNIEKFLFVSSVGAIARAKDNKLITEKTPWVNSAYTSQYGLSKYKAEMEVWRGFAEGLKVIVLCPSIILGEGDYSKGSSALFNTVYNQFPFYTNGVNGFVDVLDVVDAMRICMQSDVVNERFIINADNYSYRYIFTTIANALGVKAPHILAGPFLSGIAWRYMLVKNLFSKTKSTLTKETATTAQNKYCYDNTKFLNFFPAFTYRNMPDSIARIAAHFKNEKK